MGQVPVHVEPQPLSRPAWWALVSSPLALLTLVAGWLVGGAVQPPGYDPVRQTISALAADGAAHRWIMTAGLVGLGLGHVVTAAGLRTVRPAARIVLALAGLATLGVAVFEQPAHGSSAAHVAFATAGFVLLALWPATAMVRTHDAPAPLRAPVAVGAAVVSSALLIWFATTLSSGPVGVSERLLTAEQALWPLIVVAGARLRT